MHFVVPCQLDQVLPASIDKDYPYWLGGPINWVVQSYLILRQYRKGITISLQPVSGKINIAHVTTWRNSPRKGDEYRVSIRADYRRLFDVDFEILQNPTAIQATKQVYLTYWPVPRLLPRNETRKKVENVAYSGRLGNRNIDNSLRISSSDSKFSGLNFTIIDKQHWHDMREIDVLLAIRDFSKRTYDEKPPSKLLNAWHAGIPLIAGYDSAFSTIGNPGVDYIRVRSELELSYALERLRDEPEFYNSIVNAGRKKSQEYTREKIAQTWLTVFKKSIEIDFERFKPNSPFFLLSCRYNQLKDLTFNSASSIKSIISNSNLGSQ